MKQFSTTTGSYSYGLHLKHFDCWQVTPITANDLDVTGLIRAIDKSDHRKRDDEITAVGEVARMFRPDWIDVAPRKHHNHRRFALVKCRGREDRDVVAGPGHHRSLPEVIVDQEINLTLQAKLRQTEIMRGTRDVTADTAIRLGRYFRTDPRFWLNLQAAYDLSKAEQAHNYKKIVPRSAA